MSGTVLVVDDSQTVRQQVAMALRESGLEVVEAEDGEVAFEVMSQCPGLVLVICDINMPRKNGIELLEAVKQEPRFKSVPFLMLTTEAQPQLMDRARRAGAKGWLVKPFRADLLLAAVKKIVAS